MLRLAKMPLETGTTERYNWREISVGEAMNDMRSAGVSMHCL